MYKSGNGVPVSSSGTVTLVASPKSVEFNAVNVGNSANQKLTVSNTGSASVAIAQLATSDPSFTVDGQGALPVNLATGSSLSLNVHFKPKDAVDSTAKLTFMTSTSTTPVLTVQLHGKGTKSGQTAALTGLSCANVQITGSGTDTCTVTTDIAAPTGGLVVSLASNSPALTVPSTVTVAAGATSTTFAAKAAAVSASQTAKITATQGSNVFSASISLVALAPGAGTVGIGSLSCRASSFTGAGSTSCSLSLTAAAPSSGLSVRLASSDRAISLPSSVTVAPGALTASFTASVAPVSSSQTATVTAAANGTSKSFAIHLNAATAALQLSKTSLSFGNVALGTSVSQSVTLTSSGSLAVTINSASISGTGFSLSAASFPITLNPGQTTVLTVHFLPKTTASSTGQLAISSTAQAATVSLSGAGMSSVPTVSGISCSTVSITGALADTCTVTLSGSAPNGGVNVALVSSGGSVVVPASVMVPATAKSASFTADVAPVTSARSISISASTGSTSRSVSLQLNAATAILGVNATSISFGSVVVNRPTTQTVTLTSTGAAPVTVNSIAVAGAGFSLNSISLPFTLNPGQAASITLTFDPTATGSFSGQLTIASNSSSNSTVTVPLSGTSTPHQVTLSWQAPSSSSVSVVGYRVYRATGAGSTVFTLLGSIGAQTSYVDSSVQSGQTYSYYVTSLDSAGVESTPSNRTTVSIP